MAFVGRRIVVIGTASFGGRLGLAEMSRPWGSSLRSTVSQLQENAVPQWLTHSSRFSQWNETSTKPAQQSTLGLKIRQKRVGL